METDEILETGCGRAAPEGDNLLNDFVQGAAEAYAELACSRGERVEDDDEFALTLTDGGSAALFGNVALLRRPLLESEWPAAARTMHQFYAQQDGGPFLTFSGWPTPDVRALGFGRVGHPPLMFRPPGPIDHARAPEGLTIDPITDDDSARDYERVLIAGYPVPELDPSVRGHFLGDPAGAPRWRHFVGRLDGEPVATSSAFVDTHHVHIEFISALPRSRGRGVGFAMTAAATRVGPDRPALLIASDLGRPVYERLGYLTLSRFTVWAGHRGHST
jgi:hypothetical protein